MTRRKRSAPIKLEIHYELASEAQRQQAIMLFASMYRDIAIENALSAAKSHEDPREEEPVQ